MSNISQQRLIEMEAEMDRFEQEILAQDAGDLPKVIIGSSTYNQVAAQLKMLRAATEQHKEPKEEPVNDDSDDEHDYDADQSRMLGRNEPPPKKPEFDVPLLPPPPPPPAISSTPSFVPSQVRHRAPGPPRSGMHGPPRMRSGPPPRPYGVPPGGPGPGPGQGPMSGPPGPGPHGRFMPGPRPGFGPMGPYGPGMGPPRGPAPPPMGPGPGMGMPGSRPMGGPPDGMSGGMYGVSSGEQHASMNEEKKKKESEEDKVKVVYASAPVITVQKEPKKKKKKKKAEKVEGAEGADPTTESLAEASEIVAEASAIPKVQQGPIKMPVDTDKDDLHVADMEIDNQYLPKKEKKEKKKKFIRMAAGTVWEDSSLSEWGNDDFRLFCGDLGNEVTDEVLARAFSKYPSFIKSKVIRDKRTNKTKGYGFVSFKDPNDYVRAMREMNGKYVGNRPIKLRKSTWKERNIDSVKRKEKEKKRLGLR